jgi:hypothetical protein
MRRAYRFCLLLYPRQHRDQFAEEMLSVFEEARNERHYQGWTWYISFAFAELSGLIAAPRARGWINDAALTFRARIQDAAGCLRN